MGKGEITNSEIHYGTMTGGARSFMELNGKFSGSDSLEIRSDV